METKEIKKTSVWGILLGIIFGVAIAYGIYNAGMLLVMWLGDMMLPWCLPEILILSILTLGVIFSSVVAAAATFEYFKKI